MKAQDKDAQRSDEALRAYTPEFVADMLSLHVETVRHSLRTGRVPGVRIGSHWRITHATLSHLLKEGLPLQGK